MIFLLLLLLLEFSLTFDFEDLLETLQPLLILTLLLLLLLLLELGDRILDLETLLSLLLECSFILDLDLLVLPEPEPEYVVKSIKYVTKEIPADISVESKDITQKLGQKVQVIGYLQHLVEGGNTSGVHRYYVTDKHNKILLLDLTTEEKALFTQNGMSEGVFEVVGEYDRLLARIGAVVWSIQPSKLKEIQAHQKIQME